MGRRIDFPGLRRTKPGLMEMYTHAISRDPQPTRAQQEDLLRRFVAAKAAAWLTILEAPASFASQVSQMIRTLENPPVDLLERVSHNLKRGESGKALRELADALAVLPHATDLSRTIAAGLHPDVLAIRPVADVGYAARVRDAVETARQLQSEAVRRNLRLVFSQAKRYRSSPVPFEDLVAEGNIGLITATDRFDPRVKVLFSTYAVYWIRHAVSRSIDQHSRTVRVPVNARVLFGKLRMAEEEIESSGRIADDHALAERCGVHVERVRQIRRDVQFGVSFDTVNGSYDYLGKTGDALPQVAAQQDDALEAYEVEQDLQVLREAMGKLTPKQARIIQQRFGFGGQEERTLQEVGDAMQPRKVSRERIRQLQQRALEMLTDYLTAARERR